MKKIILGIICAVVFSGCVGQRLQCEKHDDHNQTNVVMKASFNEEKYVWEDFTFSTNRVDKEVR